jgi:hypothetical protein
MPLVYNVPDGKGGMYRIPTEDNKRVRKPANYEPWKKEWQFNGALHAHAIWSTLWYRQEITRLKRKIKKLEARYV